MSANAAVLLGAAAARVRWSELDERVRGRSRDVLLDTVAVMAGGAARREHDALRAMLSAGSGEGRSTVIGRPSAASAAEAVFLNATLPTVLQLDEGYRVSRGHPGIHVVPVALAVGEQLDRDLDDVLSAMTAGYEVAARIGTSLGGTRPEIHPHGNWGAVGAAVTAAWLYSSADPDAIARAIDIASGVAGYHDRRAAKLGAGVHHLWASIGAHTGLVAGAAAAAGMTGVGGTLEDVLLPRSGAAPRVAALGHGVAGGEFVDFAVGEGYVKFWAACGHTHTAIAAALEASARGPLSADEIERVEVRAFAAAAALDATQVPNDLAARFSIPFVVAAALLDGRFSPDSVDDAALPRLEPVARRVHVTHDPSMDAGYPEQGRPLALSVLLRDGTRLEHSARLSDGDAERPASSEAVAAKARGLLARAFGEAEGERLVTGFQRLEPSDSIAVWGAALRGAARKEAAHER